MAFLSDDDKLKKDDQQGGTDQGGGSSPFTSTDIGGDGGGGVNGAGGVSTAGLSQGGTGGWTNVQAYLNANKDSTGTSDYLKNTVGQEFNKDQTGLQTQADQTKQQGAQEAQAKSMGTDTASKLIQDASQGQNNGAVNQIKSAQNAQYGGPTQFGYQLSNDSQNYGSSVDPKNQQGWNSLLNSVYDKSAGGSMGLGQKNLQTQLDYNNKNVTQARNDLSSQYQQLLGNRDSTVAATNSALQGYQGQVDQSRGALNDYLSQQQKSLQPRAQAEADDYATYGDAVVRGRNDIGKDELNQYNVLSQILGINPVVGNKKSTNVDSALNPIQIAPGDNVTGNGDITLHPHNQMGAPVATEMTPQDAQKKLESGQMSLPDWINWVSAHPQYSDYYQGRR